MTILTVNTGSSSVRLAAYENSEAGTQKLADAKYGIKENPSSILEAFVRDRAIGEITVIAHRVVHGGGEFVKSCLIGPDVEAGIDRYSRLAPLHNPAALNWVRMCRKVFGEHIRQVAVFDTAFYSSLPEVATVYALPQDRCKQYGIRRYGFHGIAHSAMWRRWRDIRPGLKEGGKVISLQLGAGCSMTAVQSGKVIDTSMGFSPLEGLVMATRCGDIDPDIIFYLARSSGLSLEDIEIMLNHSSGLLGTSGTSSDMNALLKDDHPDARLAVDLFCYRARKYTGAYLSVLQGADAVLFGGGVGENAPRVRELILGNMEWMGIMLDSAVNSATIGKEGCISTPESKTAVWVVPVDEASVLAEEALKVIENK